MKIKILLTLLMAFFISGCFEKVVYKERIIVVRPDPAYFLLDPPPEPLDFQHVNALLYQNDIVGLQKYLTGEWLNVVKDVQSHRKQIKQIENYIDGAESRYEEINNASN